MDLEMQILVTAAYQKQQPEYRRRTYSRHDCDPTPFVSTLNLH
jgi:hypothetical protein